jgi:hypothetical protein
LNYLGVFLAGARPHRRGFAGAQFHLEGGQVTRVEEEVRRVELPGGFSVYVPADAGESTRRA